VIKKSDLCFVRNHITLTRDKNVIALFCFIVMNTGLRLSEIFETALLEGTVKECLYFSGLCKKRGEDKNKVYEVILPEWESGCDVADAF